MVDYCCVDCFKMMFEILVSFFTWVSKRNELGALGCLVGLSFRIAWFFDELKAKVNEEDKSPILAVSLNLLQFTNVLVGHDLEIGSWLCSCLTVELDG